MYGEPTKNIITKRQCGERLFKEYLIKLPVLVIGLVVFTFAWLLSFLLNSVLLIVFLSIIDILLLIFAALFIIETIRFKIGKFEMEKDKLMRIDREWVRRGRSYAEVIAFYFFGGGRYEISIADGNIKEYSNIDDEFYLICVGKGKYRIKAVYNCRLYEIKQ